MYLSRFFASMSTFSSLALQIRCFSSTQKANKVRLYLQRAKLIDLIRLALRSNANDSLVRLLNSRDLDSFVVTNALRSAPLLESSLSLIEILKENPHFSHTQNTLRALAKILAKSGQTAKLRALISGINSGKFGNAVRISFMDSMRWYAAAGELQEVLSVWDEWRALQKRTCTESYNLVMGLYAKNREDLDAVKVFRLLIDEGALPNSRTYTIMIEHLVNSRKLDSAIEVFGMLPLMRVKRTLKQYSLLVGAFTGTDRLDIVKTLLDEMQIDGVLPGSAMQSSLQRMREAGFVEETDGLIREMMPDERIKYMAYSMDSSDDDEDEDVDHEREDSVDQVQLKPWLDPSALASALRHWGTEEVSALEGAKFVWTTRLVCKMIRSFKTAETAWQFFCWVSYQPGYTHDIYAISRMIAKAARGGCIHIVDQLLSKIQSEGIRLSFGTVRLIIDFYGLSANGDAAVRVFRNIRTICGPISKSSQLLLYSSLLRTLAKCNKTTDALDILDEMILLGISPDIQTFSGLMHHFALQGDIKTVQRLFGMVRQSGIDPDGYMYKILIHAYCKCGRAALALRVSNDMRISGLMPDAATKELLVKSLWKEGKLREAAAVEEKSEEINNNLPRALPGHLYTLSSVDLSMVYNIYSSSFVANSK